MMNMHRSRRAGWRHGSPGRQGGVSIVLVTLALFMLLAFTALSVDGGNLFVAKNELHNAADAGSLAGARFLYVKDGSWVNDGTRPYDPDDPDDPFKSAEARATEAAEANNSQNSSAEVLSAQRGHWSFADRTFTPNHYFLEPVDLFEESTEDLDANPNFINAVEVTTARQQTQVEAFFGRVLGFEGYDVTARSVAYIGFAGTLRPEDVDQPIALCKEALLDPDGDFSCDVGRMISENDQTGGWTNFEHDDSGGASSNEIRDLVCGDGNPDELHFGEDIATNNGQVQSAFQAFYDCWVEETDREIVWTLTLPVIDCEDGVSPSNRLVGTVTVNIVWVVNNNQGEKIDEFAPEVMGLGPDNTDDTEWPGDWPGEEDGVTSDSSGEDRWGSFVDHFNLQDSDGGPAEWRKMSIYFLPSCSFHEPKGQTGGENFGILARIPVLVD